MPKINPAATTSSESFQPKGLSVPLHKSPKPEFFVSLLERVQRATGQKQEDTASELHTNSTLAESARAHLTDEGVELIQAYFEAYPEVAVVVEEE